MTTFLSGPKRRVPVGQPMAPAIVSRAPVFQPFFRNVKAGTFTGETAWATTTVTGRLGGIHRKVLDAMFANPVTYRDLSNGTREMVIDPYRTAKTAGVAVGKPDWLRTILRDMERAKVTLVDKQTRLCHEAHILADVWDPKDRVKQPGGALVGDRPLFGVTVSAEWMGLLSTSLVVKYRNVLPTLSQIQSGVVHAAALHVLTHSGGSFDVDKLLTIIGVTASKERRRRLVQQFMTEVANLERLGMQVYRHRDDARLMIAYTPTGDVHVQNWPRTTGKHQIRGSGRQVRGSGRRIRGVAVFPRVI